MTDRKHLDSHPVPPVDERSLYDMSLGLFGYQAAVVAFDLGLFGFLAEGPADTVEVAERFGMERQSADAMLLVCLSLGLLERDGRALRLSEVGRTYLAPDSRSYFGGYLHNVMVAQPEVTSFASIKETLLGKRRLADKGETLFQENAQDAERARAFTRSMHGHSIAPALAWPLHIDLSDLGHMIDVGGGSGAHAIGAALRWPELSAEVMELPSVTPVVAEYVEDYGLSDRISATPGNFWSDPLPAGVLHFFGDIFHDWSDEKSLTLMAKSFSALPPGGRLVIHEVLFNDEKTGPFQAAASSIAMLVWTEGRQRSGPEYRTMLEHCGFGAVSVTPTFGYWSIVVAEKPG